MYTKSLTTFIDIIGFKSLVQGEESPEFINQIINLFTNHTEYAIQSEKDEFHVYHFSDSVIRTRKITNIYDNAHFNQILYSEIYDLAFVQYALTYNGILIRGGVACGDIFAVESRVFGPSLIDAYEIESKQAIYPRILISSELSVYIKNENLVSFPTRAAFKDELLLQQLTYKDEDGLLFIDYGWAGQYDGYNEIFYSHFLQNQHDVIIKNIRKCDLPDEVRTKYIWLMKYHNKLLVDLNSKLLNDFGINIELLYIDESILRASG